MTKTFNIVVFEGDNCGPEVTAEAIKVLKAIEEKDSSVKFNLQYELLGGCSIDATGEPLTDTALAVAKSADAVLLGAVGSPKSSGGAVCPEQGLLKLHKEMQAFGNIRPCYFASDSLLEFSPLKASVAQGVDFKVVRELTGGIYFGNRKEDDGSGFALDTEPYSKTKIQRIVRLAGSLAMQHDPPLPVTSLDKANVLATSRLWRKTVDEVMKTEFPMIKYQHQLIDSAAMLIVKNPRALNGIIVTSSLFGDIISDEASVIPGLPGLLPSASLSGIPDGSRKVNGIYEPIHGSAPDIAGKGVVNPIAAILSVAMMLRYSLGLLDTARRVEDAVRQVLDSGVRTADLGGIAKTVEVGDKVAEALKSIL